MKRYILFILFASNIGFADYYNFHGVCYLDTLKAWVCSMRSPGREPIIIRTNDGGISWDTLNPYTAYSLFHIFFLNDTLGWTCGDVGEIRFTTNAGDTWIQQTVGFTKYFCRIQMLNENYGWASGGDGILAKTTDGGLTWQDIYLPTPFDKTDYYGLFFIDTLNGWIAGGTPADSIPQARGYIMRTANGGGYWHPQLVDTFTYEFLDIHFVNLNEGWVVGGDEITGEPCILHTTNGGATWTSQSLPGGAYLRGVDFVNERIGFAVGKSGTILRTNNGGANWELYPIVTSVTFFDVDFADSLHGIIVGDSNTILITRDGGNTWFGIEETQNSNIKNQILMYPNPFYQSITISAYYPFECFIYDAIGRLIEYYPKSSNLKILKSFNRSGVYFCKVKTDNREWTNKIIKIGN